MSKFIPTFILSLVLLILSIGSLGFKGLNLGLDFSGGTLIEVSYEEAADLIEIRDLMTNNGFDDFQVVNFGSNIFSLFFFETPSPLSDTTILIFLEDSVIFT